MQQFTEEKSFHPLFVTQSGAKAFPDQVYSDHLARKANIMLLTLITWNAMLAEQNDEEANNSSWGGCGYYQEANPALEETELKKERAQVESLKKEIVNPKSNRKNRIKESLFKKIAQQNPDIIFLQETWPQLENELETELQEKGYGFAKTKYGLPIIWNKNSEHFSELVPFNLIELKGQYQPHVMICILKDGHKLMLCNIHWPHREIPEEAKRQIALLHRIAKEQNCLLIIGGDFNNRIVAPNQAYLVGNLVSSYFDKKTHQQRIDWTDGFIYSNPDKPDQLEIAETSVLNPLNGATFTNEEIQEWHRSAYPSFTGEQRAAVEAPRINLDLKTSSVTEYFSGNVISFFNCYPFLRFYEATNAFGKKFFGMAIRGKITPQIGLMINKLSKNPAVDIRHPNDAQDSYAITFKDVELPAKNANLSPKDANENNNNLSNSSTKPAIPANSSLDKLIRTLPMESNEVYTTLNPKTYSEILENSVEGWEVHFGIDLSQCDLNKLKPTLDSLRGLFDAIPAGVQYIDKKNPPSRDFGKELRLFLKDKLHDNHDLIKQSLLSIWKTLQLNGIPLMHAVAPGDRKIPGPFGLPTPLSITCRNDPAKHQNTPEWLQPHGTLRKQFQPHNQGYPLLQMQVSFKDLEEKDIYFNPKSLASKIDQNLTVHGRDARDSIMQSEKTTDNIATAFQTLKPILKTALSKLQNDKEQMEEKYAELQILLDDSNLDNIDGMREEIKEKLTEFTGDSEYLNNIICQITGEDLDFLAENPHPLVKSTLGNPKSYLSVMRQVSIKAHKLLLEVHSAKLKENLQPLYELLEKYPRNNNDSLSKLPIIEHVYELLTSGDLYSILEQMDDIFEALEQQLSIHMGDIQNLFQFTDSRNKNKEYRDYVNKQIEQNPAEMQRAFRSIVTANRLRDVNNKITDSIPHQLLHLNSKAIDLIFKAKLGVQAYQKLGLEEDYTKSYLGFWSFGFDKNRGQYRAKTYLQELDQALNPAITLSYTLLNSNDENILKSAALKILRLEDNNTYSSPDGKKKLIAEAKEEAKKIYLSANYEIDSGMTTLYALMNSQKGNKLKECVALQILGPENNDVIAYKAKPNKANTEKIIAAAKVQVNEMYIAFLHTDVVAEEKANKDILELQQRANPRYIPQIRVNKAAGSEEQAPKQKDEGKEFIPVRWR